MNKVFLLNKLLFQSRLRFSKSLDHWSAAIQVKLGRPLLGLFLRIIPSTGLSVSTGRIKIIISFLCHCHKLAKKSGIPYLTLTLKGQSVVLQQVIGGHRILDLAPLRCRFKRTHSGLPKIIPILDRRRIRGGDPEVIRFWLTLFALYRVLSFKSLPNLSTIVDPSKSYFDLAAWSEFVSTWVRKTLIQNFPNFEDTAAYEGVVDGPREFLRSLRAIPFLIQRSSPCITSLPFNPTPVSTAPAAVIIAARTWTSSVLFPTFVSWCKSTGNVQVLRLVELFSKVSYIVDYGMIGATGSLGRLGFKDEPAGKVRTFAMVDPFTQWLFKPLWDAITSILSLFPQDGTFDQLKPLSNLKRSLGKWSFDLTAATDRLPIVIQVMLLSPFIGTAAADLWRQLLVGRSYDVPAYEGLNSPPFIFYGCGQPMGALTSWGMLAFTHHSLVQYAALRAGVIKEGEWFHDYALLGDDLVIAHPDVASMYLVVMDELGVSINLTKSVISPSGRCMEFAKKTIFNGVDVSAVPLKELFSGLRSVSASLEFAKKRSLSPSQYLRLFGAGYKVLGSMNRSFASMGRKWSALLLSYISPKSGVNPDSWEDYFSRKSLSSYYVKTSFRSLLAREVIRTTLVPLVIKKIDKGSDLWSLYKQLVTVNRTRSYYGTTAPQMSSPNTSSELPPFAMISLTSKNLSDEFAALEDLKTFLYRDAFCDVIARVRDLRTALEEFSPQDSIEEVIVAVESFYSELSRIPDLKGLSFRREIFDGPDREARIMLLNHLFRDVMSKRSTRKFHIALGHRVYVWFPYGIIQTTMLEYRGHEFLILFYEGYYPLNYPIIRKYWRVFMSVKAYFYMTLVVLHNRGTKMVFLYLRDGLPSHPLGFEEAMGMQIVWHAPHVYTRICDRSGELSERLFFNIRSVDRTYLRRLETMVQVELESVKQGLKFSSFPDPVTFS